MKTAKISQLADLADGQLIGEMTFKIKKAFPHKTGEGQYGPWSVQNAIVVDDTGEIRASFWADGSEPLKGLEGHNVQVKSVAGKRGLTGISAKANKKDGTIELDVKAAAAIRSLSLDSGAPIPVTQTPHTVIAKNPQVAIDRIKQSAALYEVCMAHAKKLKDAYSLPDEHYQAICASLYISSDRAGLFACFPVEAPAAPVAAPAAPMDELEEEVGW
jgi:hypothetical protein